MYDIVCSLPLELLVQIVEYLDLEDVARSQRVRNTNLSFSSVFKSGVPYSDKFRSRNDGAGFSRARQLSNLFYEKRFCFLVWTWRVLALKALCPTRRAISDGNVDCNMPERSGRSFLPGHHTCPEGPAISSIIHADCVILLRKGTELERRRRLRCWILQLGSFQLGRAAEEAKSRNLCFLIGMLLFSRDEGE